MQYEYHLLLGYLLKQDRDGIAAVLGSLALRDSESAYLHSLIRVAELHYEGDALLAASILESLPRISNEGLSEIGSVFWHILPAVEAGDKAVGLVETQRASDLAKDFNGMWQTLPLRDHACEVFLHRAYADMLLLTSLRGRLRLSHLRPEVTAVLQHLQVTDSACRCRDLLVWLLRRVDLELADDDLQGMVAAVRARYQIAIIG